MSKTLEAGDVLQLAAGRMVYVGDNKADSLLFYPARSATGGLLNNGQGEWRVHVKAQPLTDAQIAFWLSNKK